MIAMVKGTLMEKSEGEAVVMTAGGLGLRVMCSMNTLTVLPAAGQECTLYTFMNVREDAMELFGFCQKEERDMFKRLTSVSGIGPRSALGVLGSMPLADLRLAILTGDAAALSRAPGIGIRDFCRCEGIDRRRRVFGWGGGVFFAEPLEAIGIEGLCPQIRVVASGVAAGEDVLEIGGAVTRRDGIDVHAG